MAFGRRFLGTCVALALLAAPAAALAGQPPPSATVRGSVADTSGDPVMGLTVRLLKTRTVRQFKAPKSKDQVVEEARGRTNEKGEFQIDFTLDPEFHAYFVRFYDPKLFDSVKYQLPPDMEISRQVELGGIVETHVVLKTQPDWPQVKALVDEYGSASQRGQVIRTLGLPTRKETLPEGRELWVFEPAGIAYVIAGERIIETHRIETKASKSGAREKPAEAAPLGEPEVQSEDVP